MPPVSVATAVRWKYHNSTLRYVGQPAQGGTKFNPSFPATCPFVTAVGATQINPGSTVYEPESACEQVIFSGGGFSNIFSMPHYQKQAVSTYLEHHPPPYTAEQFNNSGMVKMRTPAVHRILSC
jgi:tripeptidyl-peptidase I